MGFRFWSEGVKHSACVDNAKQICTKQQFLKTILYRNQNI